MKLGAKLDDIVAKHSANNHSSVVDKHIDVHEEEGWITIPCKELPDSWIEKLDMLSIRSLDRPFVFPGEQVHILATLSTNIAGDSAPRTETHRKETQELLKRFRNSHFFARIAESDEALWSKRKTNEVFQGSTATIGGNFLQMESSKDVNNNNNNNKKRNNKSPLNIPLDRESLDASTSGGVAKNEVKCSLLANGDIVDAGAFTGKHWC